MQSKQLARFISWKQTTKTSFKVADQDLKLRGKGGWVHFWLSLPAFLYAMMFFFLFIQNKARWGSPGPPEPSLRSATALNDDDREKRVQFFSNKRQCFKEWIC